MWSPGFLSEAGLSLRKKKGVKPGRRPCGGWGAGAGRSPCSLTDCRVPGHTLSTWRVLETARGEPQACIGLPQHVARGWLVGVSIVQHWSLGCI